MAAAYSNLEGDDAAYAADAEGSGQGPGFNVKRTKHRELGRLRQRAPSKREPPSGVPGSPGTDKQDTILSSKTATSPTRKYGGEALSDFDFSQSQSQSQQSQSDWDSDYNNDFVLGPAPPAFASRAASRTAFVPAPTSVPVSPRSATFASARDSVPQLPSLPASPITPRWASLTDHSKFLYERNSPATESFPPAPAHTAISPAATPASVSPELSPIIPQDAGVVGPSSYPHVPQHSTYNSTTAPQPSPLLPLRETDQSDDDDVYDLRSPIAASIPATRPGSRDTQGSSSATMAVENFSRPRKPSVKQSLPDLGHARLRQPEPAQLEPQTSWPRDRSRGLSVSSHKSNSTYTSLRTRQSNDHIRGGRHATPSTSTTASSGIISPGLPRPPLAYRGHDSSNANSATNSVVSHGLPWMVEDELRTSYRSQLTASTAQNTIFSASGTERSSVLTKASSRTSASLFPGGVTPDESFSVEDVMGMYEKGFVDSTGAEDNDLQTDNETRDLDDSLEPHVSGPAASASKGLGNRLLEAMSESLPVPQKAATFPRGEPDTLRDSGACFANSALPSPQLGAMGTDSGVGLVSTSRSRSGSAESVHEKHDSAKLLDSDDRFPIQRHPSLSSARSAATSPPLLQHTEARNGTRPDAAIDSQIPISPATSSFARPAPAEPEDPSSWDRYGFRKKNQYISREQYDAWDSTYTDYMNRRRRKWVGYMKDQHLITENPARFPPPSVKTKRFVRKGIPAEWRGAAWFYYAGGPSIVAKHPGTYAALARRAEAGEAKPIDAEAIERDLHRTFPDNIKFRFEVPHDLPEGSAERRAAEPELISRLRTVLLAFSIYNPSIGYCQSLNFLAGLLLLFVETEEHCFWLLNVITRVFLPGTHELSLEGSKVDLGVLMTSMQDSLPSVYAKVAGELEDSQPPQPTTGPKYSTLGRKAKRPKPSTTRSADALSSTTASASQPADRLPPITLCMTAWFMSCFIGTLPIETTLRVWDIFFYEGSKTLFRVALAVFKLGESEIKAVADPMEMFGVVQQLPRKMIDCNALIEATFKRRGGFVHLSQEGIEEKRRERRDAIRGVTDTHDAEVMVAKDDAAVGEIKRKGTLFGRKKEKRAAEVH